MTPKKRGGVGRKATTHTLSDVEKKNVSVYRRERTHKSSKTLSLSSYHRSTACRKSDRGTAGVGRVRLCTRKENAKQYERGVETVAVGGTEIPMVNAIMGRVEEVVAATHVSVTPTLQVNRKAR